MTERDITIALGIVGAVLFWLSCGMYVLVYRAGQAIEIAAEAVQMLKRFAGERE